MLHVSKGSSFSTLAIVLQWSSFSFRKFVDPACCPYIAEATNAFPTHHKGDFSTLLPCVVHSSVGR